MKIRILLLNLLWMTATLLPAQTYTQLWKQVEQMQQKDLPKSVIAKAGQIYTKAETERNVPQMMKAYLKMMTYRGNISPDSIPVDIRHLETWAETEETAWQDKAVLYSLLGGFCLADDFEKGNRYLHLSLRDSVRLVKFPAERLVPMVKTGETSRLFMDNNLYDLLARRAIRLWEQNQWRTERETVLQIIRQTYQSLLNFYQQKNKRAAWLLTALDAFPQADEKQLRHWMNEYADLEVCAEVYLRLAQQRTFQEEPARRLALLREGIARYPRYNRIQALKNEVQEILSPSLRLSVESTYPNEPLSMQVYFRNLQGLTLNIYWLNLSVESPLLAQITPQTVRKYGTLLRREHFTLPPTTDYRERGETVHWQPLETGIYYAVAVPEGQSKISEGAMVYVSGVQLIYRGCADGKQEWVVLDKRSGHPLTDARVDIYEPKDGGYVLKESRSVPTDGTIFLPEQKNRQLYVQARTATDAAMPITPMWIGRVRPEVASKIEERIQLFTDRSLYRPGQTLQYAGIVYQQQNDSVWTQRKGNQTMVLLDAENKEIGTQTVVVDAFGSFSGTFNLPASGKNGVYRLKANQSQTTFHVEAYKRPTFEVTFDSVRTAYRAGDSIRITGIARSFTGVPIQGGKVSYQVVRRESLWGRMRGMETNRVTGETQTDAQGRFEMPVHFLPMEEGQRGGFYLYEVEADVTTLSGEAQTGQMDLPLGKVSVQVGIELPQETLVKEKPLPLTFRVSNLLGQSVQTEVNYQVFATEEGTDGEEKQGACVYQGKAVANQAWIPEGLYALPSGRYQLKATVKDEEGRENEQTAFFVLFGLKDQRMPYPAEVWAYQDGEVLDADGTVTLYFGSKEKDVYLLYDEYYGDNQRNSKRILFSDSLLTFRYKYKAEYGDGLRASFAFVKNGQLYSRDFYFKKPEPQKELTLRWKTFRDLLQPGGKETWTLSVSRPDGKPADAQLMATLYDASLDRLFPHHWHFRLDFARRFLGGFWQQTQFRNAYWLFSFSRSWGKVNPLVYSTLDVPFSLLQNRFGRIYLANGAVEEVRDLSAVKYKAAMAPSATVLPNETVAESEEAETSLQETGMEAFRSNFAETAFFYPQLRTNADGEITMEFTLPESLTEWKFMGLAHTKEMDFGTITAKAVSRKEWMLQSNLPRFVRINDRVNVAATLQNLSGQEISGTVRMEVFVPETGKIIQTQKRFISLKADETGSVSFTLKISDEREGIGIRMLAEGGNFSDGEQRYLPVLSDKQTLTESVLLYMNGAGTSTFSLEPLFNHHSRSVSRPKMVVEFTGNPMWLAVQALKELEMPDNDNALSRASAVYALSLMEHLAEAYPVIKDSLNVAEKKEKRTVALEQLKELQRESGAWSWFKGMEGSRLMTTQIVELLARLQRMTEGKVDAEMNRMIQPAFGYLKQEVEKEVQRMKEAEKWEGTEVSLSEQALRYLYICALNPNAEMTTETNRYLIRRLERQTGTLSIYHKALAAIVLHEAGKTVAAQKCLQSLMEYSVMTEEMGRYFDTPKAIYSAFSYRIPAEVAVMEALQRITPESEALEQMQRWLLKQKQVQVWETPIATADAVYALLTTGAETLQQSGETVIRIGKEILRTPKNQGMGYVQQEIKGKVMDFKQVNVQREASGIGWGAVYTTFEEVMTAVNAQGQAMKVERTFYRNGKRLAEDSEWQIGDRLTVRLTVTTDRDMDFIQIKDERAACLEPMDVLSGYRWKNGIGFYQETKDSATAFYLDRLPKGTHVLEYEVFVNLAGTYTQGIPTIQSLYAPEFVGHGAGGSLQIK